MGKGLPYSSKRGIPTKAGIVRKDIVPIKNVTVAITDPGAAAAWGTAVIGDLPEGNILFLGAVLNLDTITKGDADIIDAFNGDVAVGTAPATSNAAQTGALIDIVNTTPTVLGVAGVSTGTRGINASAQTGQVYNNTDGSLELNLNFLVDDASISAASSLICNGALHLAYIVLGDD